MRVSSVPRRQWASAPEKDEAQIWLAPVATATAGGMPISISSGVIRKPPPTPNSPESTPIRPPSPRIRSASTETSAMGR